IDVPQHFGQIPSVQRIEGIMVGRIDGTGGVEKAHVFTVAETPRCYTRKECEWRWGTDFDSMKRNLKEMMV
ncbi:MAG: hypothetical protein AAF471_07235, partial [Myxococcota bacterium]